MSVRDEYPELGFMADTPSELVDSRLDQRRYLEAGKALAEIAWRAEWMERAARELRDARDMFNEASMSSETAERVWAFIEESAALLAEHAGDPDRSESLLERRRNKDIARIRGIDGYVDGGDDA